MDRRQERIQDAHRIPACQQQVYGVRANESGPAGHKHFQSEGPPELTSRITGSTLTSSDLDG